MNFAIINSDVYVIINNEFRLVNYEVIYYYEISSEIKDQGNNYQWLLKTLVGELCTR